MKNKEEQVDASNQQEEVVLETTQDEPAEETIDDVKARLAQLEEAKAKAEEIAENQRIRAEKAERLAKAKSETKPEAKEAKSEGLTSLDTIALINAKVTEKEDIDVVLRYAKNEGLSIQEALGDSVVKAILADKLEKRQTALATNTNGARRGTTQVSDEQILVNVSQGKFPEDPEALAEARMNAKKKK